MITLSENSCIIVGTTLNRPLFQKGERGNISFKQGIGEVEIARSKAQSCKTELGL